MHAQKHGVAGARACSALRTRLRCSAVQQPSEYYPLPRNVQEMVDQSVDAVQRASGEANRNRHILE